MVVLSSERPTLHLMQAWAPTHFGIEETLSNNTFIDMQILQCVPNNYETDLIFPIVAAAGKLAGLDYHSASPREQTALKVAAMQVCLA